MHEAKRCVYCSKVKPLSEFGKITRAVDGRRRECRECRNDHRRVIRAADYDALLAKQDNKCAICGIDANEYNKKFSVDHDHDRPDEEARGLLCQQCNTIIGMADEDQEILKAAIGYLRHHETQIISWEQMDRGEILDEAKRLTYGNRDQSYGSPRTNHERIAALWSVIFSTEIRPDQVALAMAAVKIARLIQTPDHQDSAIDLAAYAAIAGELAQD